MAAEYGGRLTEEYVSAACSLIAADTNAKNDRRIMLLLGLWYRLPYRRRADPNARDIEGKTPLHYAAGLGYSSSIESFLRNGAKYDVLDDTRKTPLESAIDNHQYHDKEYFPTDNRMENYVV
ncbi:hypothetical protein NPIL_427051 [Nephila pilipes]|uniref:Ankyrin repeat domain-containing protein 54 n=1 Tax=Nephila pilipes TaxID=299642 RepID=A0A8X6QFW0_NEPPI|nr:hypothetical protein NPIL_427051 [Nephila pilipes]